MVPVVWQARKALADRQKDLEVKTQQLEIKLSNKHEEDIKKARRKSTQAGEEPDRPTSGRLSSRRRVEMILQKEHSHTQSHTVSQGQERGLTLTRVWMKTSRTKKHKQQQLPRTTGGCCWSDLWWPSAAAQM